MSEYYHDDLMAMVDELIARRLRKAPLDLANVANGPLSPNYLPAPTTTTRGAAAFGTSTPAAGTNAGATGSAGTVNHSDHAHPTGLTLKEADNSPSIGNLVTLIVPNGSLTDNGSGSGTLAFAAGSISGVLAAANGGTGVNNSTRTLTISSNGGTLDFSAASSTLTIPATGTAALRASSATAGRVAFWSSATEISHDAALQFDAIEKQLLLRDAATFAYPTPIYAKLTHTSTQYSYAAVVENDHTNDAQTGALETVGLSATVRYRGSASDLLAAGDRQVVGAFVSAFNYNSGTTGRVQAFSFDVRNLSTGTVTEMVGANVPAFLNSGGGTITTAAGLRLEQQTAAGTNWQILSAGGNWRIGPGYLEIDEVSAPAAGAANTCRLYVEDNGSGKSRLMALFASGAAQQLAIQP